MPDILDPSELWLGTPGRDLAKLVRPVAVTDLLTVEQDAAATLIDVLANDSNPAGGPLTLLSAFAALGSATVQGGQVSYTPPPGFTGADTVVYEIENATGGRRSGQVDVTVEVTELSVDATPDNRLTVTAAAAALDLTLSDPPVFADTYGVDAAGLASGPVNLAPPTLSGTFAEGEVLTAADGLWITAVDAAPVTRTRQWQDQTGPLPGETGPTLTLTAAMAGGQIALAETLGDTRGARTATSAWLGSVAQSGDPGDDPALIGWWDADDAATLTEAGSGVSSWADKAGGANPLVQTADNRRPATGTRTLNGRNVLEFNGLAFLFGDLPVPPGGDIAFHMALVIDQIDNAFVAPLSVDGTNDFQIDANSASAFQGRLNVAGLGATTTLSGGPFAGGMILSAVFDVSGTGTATIWIGDTERASMPLSQPISPSVVMRIMTNRSANTFLDGAVAELIVSGAADASSRAAHHAYLSSKWGLA